MGARLDRRFWLLFTGLTVSRFGDGFLTIGVLWQIYAQTGSVAALAATYAVYWAALSAARTLTGPLADRYDRRRLMVTLDLARAALTAVPLGLAMVHDLPAWVLAAVYVATGGLSTTYGPASSASLPRLVEPRALPRANSLLYGASEAAHLIGPGVGGLVIAALGAPQAMALDGLSFALCAACIAALPLRAGGGGHGAAATSLAAGWREIRRRPALSVIAALLAALWATDTVFLVLFVPLVIDRLHGGSAGVGLLESSVSAGAIVAAWLAQRARPALIWASVPLFCLSTAAMAVAPTMGWAYLLQALAGFFTGLFLIRANTTYQVTVPDGLLGRTMAARQAAVSAARSGGALLAGGLALGLGIAATFGAVGLAGAAVSGALAWRSRRRSPSPWTAQALPDASA